ncbi:rod shape-determining protein MreD [Anaerosporobacter faecicola]|uniref:rod shape-determining protein MreD n=1 Tax=Anaerosporobacter faecicola TaxID=2718714 RepID=UPI001439E09C|nr:rod shape-determining protein MreD [Anaerosporobacter faecicola]
MKRFFMFFITIIVCFLLQSTVFQALSLAGVAPNLLLIVTVAAGYMYGRTKGIYVGLACGLLVDICYGDIIGLFGLMYMCIGYLNGYAHKIYFRDDYTMPIILVSISDFLYGFFYYVFLFLLRNRLNFFFYLRRIILPELIYTVVVSIVLYKILHILNVKLERSAHKEV